MPYIKTTQEIRNLIIDLLLKNWSDRPDLRLGQLISNLSYRITENCDPFHVEDLDLLSQLLKEREDGTL